MERFLNELVERTRPRTGEGRTAAYIPELKKQDPALLGVDLLRPDGSHLSAGDWDVPFTIQSIIKPVILLLALMDNGIAGVRRCIGVEATGRPFDAINLSGESLSPQHFNPMVNMGAIAICGLIHGASYEEKFQRLLELTRKLAGNPDIQLDQDVYLSEKHTGYKNRALAFLLKTYGMLEDDVEEVLITSDVGVETTVKIIRRIEERVARDKYMNTSELQSILREEVMSLMEESHGSEKHFGLDARQGEPYVVMVVGVNGAGKTTTIGKLAAQLGKAGRKVWIGAADTFRAAAIDQLQVWADRAGATMIRQQMGSDPASVAFDTLTSAKANGADVVLIDTAGRLHNKVGLMNELTKIRNVMGKVIPGAPHEVMLVLDGSTGQNAFEQAKQFTQATQVTSLTITKLDGTAKGGVVIGISDQFHIPVRYIGIGEGIDQLRIFDRKEFVNALLNKEKN